MSWWRKWSAFGRWRVSEMNDLKMTPWAYWSPETREWVRMVLRLEQRRVLSASTELSWADFPVLRQRAEDRLRALADLEQVVAGLDDGTVAMGDEVAP